MLGAIDATEQASAVEAAAKQGIVVLGWHSYATPGPHPKLPIFTNITTDPLEVAKAAASYAVADSDGKVGAVIFTDSVYEIAIAKSTAMADVIKACSTCKLLEVIDLTAFVAEQRERLASGGVAALVTPRERVYRPADPAVADRLGLAQAEAGEGGE